MEAGPRVFAELALIALIAEAVLGYPGPIYRRIGHPVTWFGALIARCDETWNRLSFASSTRRISGLALVVLLVSVSVGAGLLIWLAIQSAFASLIGLIAVGVIASSLLSQRSLDAHVTAVAAALEDGDLTKARSAAAKIVGREPDHMDQAAVSRAAIESLAENFSDGVVAPVFWMLVAGLPGALAYKAINTADSMIGHKTERHLAFGWAAARTDDVVNFPASRLAALWITLAAALLPGKSARSALRAIWNDAAKHRSPNAGWPEAAIAGALHLSLAGPRIYDGECVDDDWIGNGRSDATARDIRHAIQLYRTSCALQLVAVAAMVAVRYLS